jgi:hypothetical protein
MGEERKKTRKGGREGRRDGRREKLSIPHKS